MKYEPHWDHQAYPGSKSQWEDNLGSRIATWLTYLSVPELGGKTCFLDLEIAAEPIKNSAVFWYNHKPSGASDDRTRHAACPVVVGLDLKCGKKSTLRTNERYTRFKQFTMNKNPLKALNGFQINGSTKEVKS